MQVERGEAARWLADADLAASGERPASPQFLASVLDALGAQVCVLDAQGTIVAVNRAWQAFGLANGDGQAAQQVGSNYLQACQQAAPAGPEAGQGPAFATRLAEVLAGASAGFEFSYPCHSPTEQRWFVARVSRVPGGGPPFVVVAHDDVTALRQAQETLREGEALLRDLAASIPGAMFRLVQRAGGGWGFVYFSPGIEALYGLTPAQACGDIRALGQRILAEDRPAHDASIRAAVAAGRPWEHEYRIGLPDGTVKWVHARASAKPGADGHVMWTGVLTDVSQRKHMESVLKASEQRYRTLFETVPQGVVYQGLDGRITSANPAAQRILGLSLAQMQGLHSIDPRWQAIREDGSPFSGDQHPAMVALRTGQPVQQVVMGVTVPDRGCTWLLVNAIPLHRQGQVHEVYASFEDITERVLLSHELKLQASTDYLTGAANRRSLMQRLALEHERVQRHAGRGCAVLAIDLDHFKRVNDQHGHAAGDTVLQHVARLMQQETRQRDLVARSGGEEFTVLLPDVGADEALALAERLRQRLLAQPPQHLGQPLLQTVSIGVSQIGPADAGPDDVLLRADQALYRAKAAGRNQVCG